MGADLDVPNTATARIGETAGMLWHYLHANGPTSVTGLARQLGLPRDLVMQAIGWLAREDKVDIAESGRAKTIGLK